MESLPSRHRSITSNCHARYQGKHRSLHDPDFDPSQIPTDCVVIPLTNGGYALVDEEDACRIDEFNWYKWYCKSSKTWYASTILYRRPRRRYLLMHRHLFGLGPDDRIQVDHKNHDGLDNRRSENLRLATSRQNGANRRKAKNSLSRYKGVTFIKRYMKWTAKIAVNASLSISLGSYGTEEEAALAFQLAAPLVKDPNFVHINEIPDERMPDDERQREIRLEVTGRIKARMAGKKGRLLAVSKYIGVRRYKNNRFWYSVIEIDGRDVYLGSHGTEMEAAFSYNCGVDSLGARKRRMNGVREVDIESHDRVEEIRSEVAKRIASFRTGEKVQGRRSSRFRGVSFNKDGRKWSSSIRCNRKKVLISYFEIEIHAAIAYNVATRILGNYGCKPNPIQPEEMPDPDIVRSIELKVISRLDRLAFPIPPTT